MNHPPFSLWPAGPVFRYAFHCANRAASSRRDLSFMFPIFENRSLRSSARAAVVAALFLALGCGDKDPVQPPPPQGVMPDFSLQDANPNSATYGQQVSPRQFLGDVSAWYFGHAT